MATLLPHPAAGSAGAVSRPCLWSPGLIGISSRLLAGLVSGPGRAWASCLPGCERVSAWAWGDGRGLPMPCKCAPRVHEPAFACVHVHRDIRTPQHAHGGSASTDLPMTAHDPREVHPSRCTLFPVLLGGAEGKEKPVSTWSRFRSSRLRPYAQTPPPPGTSPSDSTLISPSRYFPQLAPLPSHPGPASSLPISSRPRPSYLDTEASHTSAPPRDARDTHPPRGLSSGGGASDGLARSSPNRDPKGPTNPTWPLGRGQRWGRQVAAHPRNPESGDSVGLENVRGTCI